jgi:hypothetical protein
VDDKATLPYSLGLGLAFSPPNTLINVDLLYTDWKELDYPGLIRDPETDEYLYDPTTDIRIGAEYTLGVFPLRFRAGYAHVPLAFKYFDVVRERRAYSLGIGGVFETALALDFAWQHVSFEREAKDARYSEERTIDRAILTIAYRF